VHGHEKEKRNPKHLTRCSLDASWRSRPSRRHYSFKMAHWQRPAAADPGKQQRLERSRSDRRPGQAKGRRREGYRHTVARNSVRVSGPPGRARAAAGGGPALARATGRRARPPCHRDWQAWGGGVWDRLPGNAPSRTGPPRVSEARQPGSEARARPRVTVCGRA
jgi:hypothetical protein